MKKLIFIFLFTFSSALIAQIQNPIKWSTSVEKISDKEYDLIITAEIERDWHLYSQHTADGGSLPIFISKKQENKDFELIGNL
jgi:thiol:disulfide interchange protein DsbD